MARQTVSELHDEAVRVDTLARNDGLLVLDVADDGPYLRPFLRLSDQRMGDPWDRVCHHEGEVWIEAWAARDLTAFFRHEAKPRYLKWEEVDSGV